MTNSSHEKITFDFTKHRADAITAFREVLGLYEDLAETSKRIITNALSASKISVHSIEARAKSVESFANKASKPALEDSCKPKYSNPLIEITDLTGLRVITFLPRVVEDVCRIIENEFVIIEQSNKAEQLIDEGKFGYQSIHFLVKISSDRAKLAEYHRFENLVFEIQVRTILQHAWAEMEHDIQYKSANVIPTSIQRRFISLAGLLEIADREFQALQDDDEHLRTEARESVKQGKLVNIEITPDSLKAYLDKKFGPDGRQSEWSYNAAASILKKLGFTSLSQVDECIKSFNQDEVSKVVWGYRQGQVVRFEESVHAGMGKIYAERHPWAQSNSSDSKFWSHRFKEKLTEMRKGGIKVGAYDPSL
ncbi:MAG: GTP pyrophosphokinase family protein [Methylophilaceae bacterium]